MCGIFFSLTRDDYVVPDASTEQLLKNRGPDSIGKHQTLIPQPQDRKCHATFISTVLSLRGASVVEQPLRDPSNNSVLCWNGEAWSVGGQPVQGNDSARVFQHLLRRRPAGSENDRKASIAQVVEQVATIRGPFAFVFYDAVYNYLYWGRDCLGRRSLLQRQPAHNELIISSVCDGSTGDRWTEVDAIGMSIIDLTTFPSNSSSGMFHVPYSRRDMPGIIGLHMMVPFPVMNNALPTGPCGTAPKDVTSLSTALKRSLEIRIQRVRESVTLAKSSTTDINAEVAILFSGGLDCTILARLSHDLLPLTQSIDLLNVAFENPRVHSNLDPGISPYKLCPDRITGRSAYAELMRVCPGRRWRFVAVNVPYHETVAHRSKVMQLMHPHNTEMDLSISYALYFASRGTGLVDVEDGLPSLVYSTPAHVLLSGFGADELFGGYQRHATAFARRGYAGLVAELELDYLRISMRNLGRDDRVISDSGKEVRFPYLDEDVVALTLGLPAWAKCDFANAQSTLSDQPAIFLEPAKRLLRLVAWELGMHSTAAEKKRAIQFGARTAKMESGKSKGTHVLT